MVYDENDQFKDFFERTFKILDQYDGLQFDEKDCYDITLLINCLFGIIIVSHSYCYKKLIQAKFSENINGIIVLDKNVEVKLKDLSVRETMTKLRNSLAHWGDSRDSSKYCGVKNIHFFSTSDKISGIIISNTRNNFSMKFESKDSLIQFLGMIKNIIIS